MAQLILTVPYEPPEDPSHRKFSDCSGPVDLLVAFKGQVRAWISMLFGALLV